VSGVRLVPADILDLVLMHLARVRRRKLGGREGVDPAAFYEDFFSEIDVDVLTDRADKRKSVRLGSVREAVGAQASQLAAATRILDVGCGCGDNLASLAELGNAELHGVEYADANVSRARALLGGRAAIKQGSALDLPYADAEFDIVTCIEVLEHLTDDSKALREIRRVLRRRGVLVLTVPHRHWFPSYRKLIGHERHYDRQGLVQLLARNGFAVERYLPNFPRWHRAADYAYVLARIAGMLSARLGGEGAPHRVRLPGFREPLLASVNRRLEPLYEAEAKLDYSVLDGSTSVAARRVD
jgi:ubiquinone/menaquinone biosynthesis C-methylase UbiE